MDWESAPPTFFMQSEKSVTNAASGGAAAMVFCLFGSCLKCLSVTGDNVTF